MSEHIFLLGKNKELSLAEIEMYYRHRGRDISMRMIAQNGVLVESDNIPDADELGGTIKIIRVFDRKSYFDPFLVEEPHEYKEDNNKVVFGLSVYGKSRSWSRKNTDRLKKYQKNVKDILKNNGINSRFINFRGEVDNVYLAKKEINDIVFFFTGDSFYYGITESFSNPLEYKKRDEEKPVTVSTMGIPIRLAKIMLNLVGVKEGTRFHDPFCGTGIILQEAALMKANLSGSDLDPRMVSNSKRNLKWTADEYKLPHDIFSDIKEGDATKLSRIVKDKFDVIVTEPYFGPALKKISSQKTAKHMVNKTVAIYNDSMKQFSMLIKKGGYLCIVVPSYRTKKNNVHMNFRKIFSRYGFEEVNIREGIEQPFREEKKTLTREIFLLIKN